MLRDLEYFQKCPIGMAADIIGDKWSLIILRDIAIFHRQTFSQILRENIEGISSATLANKLKRLCDIGFLTVRDYKGHKQKKLYCLTEPAIDFVPVLFYLASWTALHQEPNKDYVKLLKPFLDNEQGRIDKLLEGLHDIHINHQPKEALWWTKTVNAGDRHPSGSHPSGTHPSGTHPSGTH